MKTNETQPVVLGARDQELVQKAQRALNQSWAKWLDSLSYENIHEAANDGTLVDRFCHYGAGGPRF